MKPLILCSVLALCALMPSSQAGEKGKKDAAACCNKAIAAECSAVNSTDDNAVKAVECNAVKTAECAAGKELACNALASSICPEKEKAAAKSRAMRRIHSMKGATLLALR